MFVRSWCWLGRIVLRRLDHVRLLGLLRLRMLIGFGLWLRLRLGLCGLQMSRRLVILGRFGVGRWR